MAIIYCIECNITGEKYIGSTIQKLSDRIKCHCCTKYNNYRSRQIIDRNDYKYYILEELGDLDKKAIEDKEAEHIRNTEKCVNRQIPNRSTKQWKLDNIEKWRKYDREYKSTPTKCECGAMSTIGTLARHRKTKIHTKRLTEIVEK